VAPALLLAVLVVGLALILGFENRLGGGQRLLAGGTVGRVLFIAIVIGLGEEYLFRGLLYAIAQKTGLGGGDGWLLSLSFAAWHIPDALPDGPIFVVGTMMAMFVVSHFVLYPLRRASGNVASPALVHIVSNVGLSFVAF
jgi:membrane protease YdiL (CAAX protease family)